METGGEVRIWKKAIAGAGVKKRGEREAKREKECGSDDSLLTSEGKANIFPIRKTTCDLRH